MIALRFISPSHAPVLSAAALLLCLAADAFPRSRRAKVLRQEDISDWLLRDIGLLDGRDVSARMRLHRDA